MMLNVKAMAVAVVMVLGACDAASADDGAWSARSTLVADQESDCASAPTIESLEVAGDIVTLTLRFPGGEIDTRGAAWAREGAVVHIGSTMTWSEWTLRGATLEDSEQGFTGVVTWDGWITCRQQAMVTAE